ncbi:hypothetical protein M011DRAFT_463179 [Sporormia fimetaria CBS 119925]|uniref:S-adenosyl-L-methionine-dependent methyltransferase n=1 Tax=Sporormia fimetaria CBS 119925 TaxID=1340428 RepID=A0A6A6VP96_9PLEO|nr:hypothetical protein M011DRAFT_463179 [Sporormia fimetaria CBS 119925]
MAKGEKYWLGHASEEVQRLAEQHFLWTKAIGYLIHPSIAATLPPNARIADLGCGTGIWLVETSKSSPSTYTFAGFDATSSGFPPSDHIPSNVHLQLGDFKSPFPEHLHGQYDMLNIRLVVLAMGADVWQHTLRNMLTLLKPGGAIQWTEGDFITSRGYRGTAVGSTSGAALTRMQQMMVSTMKKRFAYNFPDLATVFEEEGLKGVEEDVVSSDRVVEVRTEMTSCAIGAVAGMLANLAETLGTKGEEVDGFWSTEEVALWKERAERDVESGAYLRWDIHVWIGFTPAA